MYVFMLHVFMLHHYRARLHLVMCVLWCWFVSFIVLSDELRAVRNEGSCGLIYLSMLYRFRALLQRCFMALLGCIYGCDKSEFLI